MDPRSGVPGPGRQEAIQRRVLLVLSAALICAGLGVAGAITAGGLLIAEVTGSDSISGLSQTAMVLGGAGFAIPLARLSGRRGRRAGLGLGFVLGILGAGFVVLGAAIGVVAIILLGLLLFGGAPAAALQARFAAIDLADRSHVSRDLAIVMWMSAMGAVIGPNLVGPASATAETLGFPALSGIFLWSAAGFGVAAVVIFTALRPDPLLMAQRWAPTEGKAAGSGRVAAGDAGSGRAAALDADDGHLGRHRVRVAGVRAVRSSRSASLAFVAIVTAHAAMIGLMVMTPLHLNNGGLSLQIVGVVVSVHILGMYLFAPLIGALADAIGQVPVIASGALTMGVAGVLAAAAPVSATVAVGFALLLLGVGWSCCMVAGSSLLTASLAVSERPAAQGLTDLSMGLAGATAGALAGVVFGVWSYAVLGILVAVVVAPLAGASLLRGRAPAAV